MSLVLSIHCNVLSIQGIYCNFLSIQGMSREYTAMSILFTNKKTYIHNYWTRVGYAVWGDPQQVYVPNTQ